MNKPVIEKMAAVMETPDFPQRATSLPTDVKDALMKIEFGVRKGLHFCQVGAALWMVAFEEGKESVLIK